MTFVPDSSRDTEDAEFSDNSSTAQTMDDVYAQNAKEANPMWELYP